MHTLLAGMPTCDYFRLSLLPLFFMLQADTNLNTKLESLQKNL